MFSSGAEIICPVAKSLSSGIEKLDGMVRVHGHSMGKEGSFGL